MADKKISALTGASTPLAGTEVLPIVQSGSTVKVAVSDLTAGRTVNAASLITTGNAGVGVTPSNWGTSGAVFKSIEMGMVGTGVAGLASPSVPELELLTNVYYNGGSGGWIYANTGATALRASLNGDVAGAFTWNVAPSGTAGGVISFTQAMKLDNSANLTVNAGNVIIGTSGKGIDFSATSGSGTSELLADYEEGTWTTTVTNIANFTGTPTLSSGKYTKVGRLVTIEGKFSGTVTVGSSTTYFEFTLPFNRSSSTDGGAGTVFTNSGFKIGGVYNAGANTTTSYLIMPIPSAQGSGADVFFFSYSYYA